MAGISIRPAAAGDLERIAEIQAASAEAAQWDPHEYLQYETLVALCEDCVAGFLVARRIAAEQSEILNLAVEVTWRRRGIGRQLVREALRRLPGEIFLEVRESNHAARQFYEIMGFKEIGRRPAYYPDSAEGAIVMKVYSC